MAVEAVNGKIVEVGGSVDDRQRLSMEAIRNSTGTEIGFKDFLRLFTEKMKMPRDPFSEESETDTLAQLASFTHMSNSAEMNKHLVEIGDGIKGMLMKMDEKGGGRCCCEREVGSVNREVKEVISGVEKAVDLVKGAIG